MEIRRHRRILLRMEAEVISDGKICAGVIGNLSEDGVFMSIPSPQSDMALDTGMKIELKFRTPSGEVLHLPCRIKWIKNFMTGKGTCTMGMEISESSDEYRNFLSGRVEY